jgi:hypothetical protein
MFVEQVVELNRQVKWHKALTSRMQGRGIKLNRYFGKQKGRGPPKNSALGQIYSHPHGVARLTSAKLHIFFLPSLFLFYPHSILLFPFPVCLVSRPFELLSACKFAAHIRPCLCMKHLEDAEWSIMNFDIEEFTSICRQISILVNI